MEGTENLAPETGRGAYELRSARFLAADILRRTVRDGDAVVDATMGNGHDTLFLCSLVGETGKVYAFDIQPDAVEKTWERLSEAGMACRAVLFNTGHEHMAELVPCLVRAAVFNLGWLPGGDHGITTRTETTLRAVNQALELLLPMGVLVLCAYPGHEEGGRELEALERFFTGLSPREFNVLQHTFLNAGPGAPVCFAVQKMRTADAPAE